MRWLLRGVILLLALVVLVVLFLITDSEGDL